MSVEAEVKEAAIGPWRQLTIGGSRRAVFAALGWECRREIRDWLETSTDLPRLEQFRGTARLEEITEATRFQCPDRMVELEALAEGAGVDSEDLLLINLRGDLTNLGEGCSDIAIVDPATMIVAHNEDGAPELDGLCVLLSIHIDDQTPVTSVWYPGLLPGMTCWLNGAGLACGIDHIPVAVPGVGAGRHFLARRLQEATSIGEMVRLVESTSVAGGYAYTVRSRSEKRSLNLEVGPGGVSFRPISGIGVHTNHFVSLDEAQSPDRRSYERLEALQRIPQTIGVEGLLRAMTDPNGGISRDATGDDPLMTHCSIVFDLQDQIASVVLRHDPTVHRLAFADFLG